MHDWSSDWPYFAEVEEAAVYIGDFCVKWARIQVRQTKEKYGTVRVYCGFGFSQLHTLLFPRYMYSRFPNWLWRLDLRISYSLLGRLFWRAVNKVAVPYQCFIYRLAHKHAIKRWPMIREEILGCPDYPEFLKGL